MKVSYVKRKHVVSAIFALLISMLILPQQSSAQSVVLAPTFSHQRGFYTSAFQLTLTAADGATIRYSLDGSTPTPATGILYTDPIPISATSVVRAIAYTSATVKSPLATHSYIFLEHVRQQSATPLPGWPTKFAADKIYNGSTIVHPADYEMDPEVLNHPNNVNKFDAVMKSLPTISIVTDLPNLWDEQYGIYWNPQAKEGNPVDPYTNPVSQGKWERPISIEWINPDGSTGFAEHAGMRIHGQASRQPYRTPKRSFRLYFKKGYGTNGLEFRVFDDAEATGKFDRLVLRNGGNRSWPYFDRNQRRETDYVNDEWGRQAWGEMGHLTSHGTYVHLYLNGLYWGLYNVAERIDEKFLAAYHPGLADTNFDLIEPEEEQKNAAVASVGTIDAYNELLGLVRANELSPPPVTDAEYNLIKTKIDLVDLADYFILNHYIGKTDWPDHNWNIFRATVGTDTRFKFVAWDNDSGLNRLNENITLDPETPVNGYLDAPVQFFNRLTTHAEFRQILTDRLYKHVIDPTGTLAPQRCAEIYTSLTAIVDQAVIGESARWGDYMRDVYPSANSPIAPLGFPAYLYSRDLPDDYTDPSFAISNQDQKTWLDVRSEKLSSYCPYRSGVVHGQYETNGWYPTTATIVNVPNISKRGGYLPANNPSVVLDNTSNANAGEIYYTTDGTDPRAEFGAIAGTALTGDDTVSVTMSRATTLKVRVLNGTSWSPLLDYDFAPEQDLSKLVMNEIHYNPAVPVTIPAQDPKKYEFIELYNWGTQPIQLDRIAFSRGISYSFAANSTLQPGQYLVLASDTATFQNRYSFAPDAIFTGSLANEGEALELVDALGAVFDSVSYKPTEPWPTAPNGSGASLSLHRASFDNSLASSWRASMITNGTPGADNGHTKPTIIWDAPADIVYGTALGSSQLNASAQINGTPIAGSFSYTPAAGTVLDVGANQQLNVSFTPDDPVLYDHAMGSTQITVLKATPSITWNEPAAIAYGTALGSSQLNASAQINGTPITGSFSYTPAAGTVLDVGANQQLNVSFTPDDTLRYSSANASTQITVLKARPSISWNTPAAIVYGTPLSTQQLNASVTGNIPGSFSYDPPLGTVLHAGTDQILKLTFIPEDSASYESVNMEVSLDVLKATLIIQAESKSKLFGTANPPLIALYSNLI